MNFIITTASFGRILGVNVQGTTFSASGNVTYNLTGGVDYSASGGMGSSLSDIITSYNILSNPVEVPSGDFPAKIYEEFDAIKSL